MGGNIAAKALRHEDFEMIKGNDCNMIFFKVLAVFGLVLKSATYSHIPIIPA